MDWRFVVFVASCVCWLTWGGLLLAVTCRSAGLRRRRRRADLNASTREELKAKRIARWTEARELAAMEAAGAVLWKPNPTLLKRLLERRTVHNG